MACCAPILSKEITMFEKVTIVDLSHTLNKDIPTWNGLCGFQIKNRLDYDQGARVQDVTMHAGIGTHIDAPAHFVQGAKDIAQLSLENLIVPVVKIDVSEQAHKDYFITVDDIQKFEKKHGKILAGSLVIGHTGWAEKWSDPQSYRNVDSDGKMHFPSWDPEAVKL